MYPLKFTKCLSEEERLLTEKYKLLRGKKEDVKKLQIVPPKNLVPPVFFRKAGNNLRGNENADSAVEKAKKLIMAGRISISPQTQQRSFKRSMALERKLSEGQQLKMLKKESSDHTSSVQQSSSTSEDARGKAQPSSSQKFQFQAFTPDPTTVAHRMQQRTTTGAVASNLSPAALGWTKSITSTNHSRQSKSSGGYFDYKRRIIKYDDNSSDDD